ncbi:MAG: hypothetical protein Q8M08_10500 [Bacteroidales bacterium]|nr:hypothetical protein [Bacteroidales bacterium]
MRTIIKIIIGILVFMIVYSCRKDEPKHYYISDAFKRWTVFKKGSYWIFQNDSTLAFDSVFVKENPTSIDVPSPFSKDNFTLEQIDMSYSSKFFYSSMITLEYSGQQATFYISTYNFGSYMLIASSFDNFIPYYGNTQEGSVYQVLSSDSVFYLGLQKFYNVVSAQHTINKKSLTCWFARDIGLIKVTGENTNPDYSWSLLRYHIEN